MNNLKKTVYPVERTENKLVIPQYGSIDNNSFSEEISRSSHEKPKGSKFLFNLRASY